MESPESENNSTTKARTNRRNRMNMSESNVGGKNTSDESIETSQPKNRKPRNRREKPQGVTVMSPTGEKLMIDPQDIETEGPDHVSVAEISQIQPTARNAKDTPNKEQVEPVEETVWIQEKGHFRRKSKKELKVQVIKTNEIDDSDENEESEMKTKKFLKYVQLITLGISYFCYGLLAGMGLLSLIIFPFAISSTRQIGMKTEDGLIALFGYENDALNEFLGFYSSMSLSVSNAFTIVGLIVLLQSIDTRAAERLAREKFIKEKEADPSSITRSKKDSVRKRGISTSLLVTIAWILFFSNCVMYYVDLNLYEGAYSKLVRTHSGYPDSLGFRVSQIYSDIGNSTVESVDKVSVVLDWWWYEVADAIVNSSEISYSKSFSFDIKWWCGWNIIRGFCSILLFLIALLEIKFRNPRKQ